MSIIIGCGLFMIGMIAFTGWLLCRANSEDDITTGTESPIIRDDKGWTYPAHGTVRERYESECG